MGVKEVYMTLQELFPQIDSRVLRAVAIEHSKDADSAVESVLAEIIPFFTERSRQNFPSNGIMNADKSSKVPTSMVGEASLLNTAHSSADQDCSQFYDVNGGFQQSFCDANDGHIDAQNHYEGGCTIPGLKSLEKCEKSSTGVSNVVFPHLESATLTDRSGANHNPEISADLEKEETISDGKCPENISEAVSNRTLCHMPRTLEDVDKGVNQNVNSLPDHEEFDGPLDIDSNVPIHKENCEGKLGADGKSFEVDGLAEHPSLQDRNLGSVQLVVAPDMQDTDLEEPEECLSTDTTSKIEATNKMVGIEDGSNLNGSIPQSGQVHVVDRLEDAIADARNNKKTLFSAMESIISMMKEVEHIEKTAEQAKMETANGDTEIFDRVVELRQMVRRAKETNDMHAGELYGEKAILATELKELQSRVLSLSDERDKSLATLHEMRQSLEKRLAAARNVIKSTEQEKLEKENSARKALANQELIMEQVVQESKKLKQQAEESARLREFLVDRGRVVDILQGEIAVIRQDVRMLKQKFDERVPFSKSLYSSQTSFILASSTSSLKTLIPDKLEQVSNQIDSMDNSKKTVSERCFDEQISERETKRDAVKEHVDDGWEIFDNRDIDM